jgi:hypothetical protein
LPSGEQGGNSERGETGEPVSFFGFILKSEKPEGAFGLKRELIILFLSTACIEEEGF